MASNVDVEAFFGELRSQQARFLDALHQLSAELLPNSGSLQCMAATQARLTRQFFDAQRALIRRRAEADTQAALIRRSAQDDARAVVAAALEQVAASGMRSVPQPAPAGIWPPPDAAAGRARGFDLASPLIDGRFIATEPDGAAAQRQLAALLDEWWVAENLEGRDLVDDAYAGVAMVQHLAAVEARRIIESAVAIEHDVEFAEPDELGSVIDADLALTFDAPPASDQVLPDQLLAAFESADRISIDLLLDELAASLGAMLAAEAGLTISAMPGPGIAPAGIAPAGIAGPGRASSDLVLRTDLLASARPAHVAAVAPDAEFWAAAEATTPDTTSNLKTLLLRVVAPMTAVTVVFALLMAWIG